MLAASIACVDVCPTKRIASSCVFSIKSYKISLNTLVNVNIALVRVFGRHSQYVNKVACPLLIIFCTLCLTLIDSVQMLAVYSIKM